MVYLSLELRIRCPGIVVSYLLAHGRFDRAIILPKMQLSVRSSRQESLTKAQRTPRPTTLAKVYHWKGIGLDKPCLCQSHRYCQLIRGLASLEMLCLSQCCNIILCACLNNPCMFANQPSAPDTPSKKKRQRRRPKLP